MGVLVRCEECKSEMEQSSLCPDVYYCPTCGTYSDQPHWDEIFEWVDTLNARFNKLERKRKLVLQ